MCGACVREAGLDAVVLPKDSAVNEVDAYAVIVRPYVALKDRPGVNGISTGHVRRNDVCQVKGKVFVSVNDQSELWVELDGGWLDSTCVELYSSKEKALTASKQVK